MNDHFIGTPVQLGRSQETESSRTPQQIPLKTVPASQGPARRGPYNNTVAGAGAPISIPQYRRMKYWADHLSISERTLKRLLEDDPDVLVIGEKKRGTRVYETRLIPESSIKRVLERLRAA